jgi:hypothetical protein
MTLEELEAAVGLLDGRVTSLEGSTAVGILADRVTALENSLTALDERTTDLEDDLGLLTTRMTTVETSTPTLEELLFSTVIASWNGGTVFSSGLRMTLFCAPFAVRILGMDISIEYSSIAGPAAVVASDTHYWRLVLERGLPSGSFPDMAAKATKASGAEAGGTIFTRKTWSFDSADWNTDRDLDKGDLLCLLWQATGSPTDIRLPMTATVRYAAL